MKSSIQPLLVLVFVMGLLIQAAPLQQTAPDGAHTHAELERLRLDYIALEERVAILEYGRDSQATNTPIATDWELATLVSTITQSETPHVSPTRTPSPSATRTPVIAAPTVTNTPQGAAPTPTLDEVPMEPTIEDVSTPISGDLVQFYGNATSQNVNIRACAGTSCPVVGTLPEHGSLGLCAGSAVVVGSYEFWQIATLAGEPERWIAVRNVDNGALLMASLDHEQVSVDTEC